MSLSISVSAPSGELSRLTTEVTGSSDEAIDRWSAGQEAAVERWLGVLSEIRASGSYDTTTLPVALREVRRLLGDGEEREDF